MTRPRVYGLMFGWAALAGLTNAPPAGAVGPSVIAIFHPWIAAPPGGAPTAAGYLTLKNLGKKPEIFLGGESAVAQAVEIHSMSMTGGIMRMRAIPQGLTLQPGQVLTLRPGGGDHLMIIHPKHALEPGETVPAVLHFRGAGSVKVTFKVEAPGTLP